LRSGECGVVDGARQTVKCVPAERLDEFVECSPQLRTPNSPLRTLLRSHYANALCRAHGIEHFLRKCHIDTFGKGYGRVVNDSDENQWH